MSSSYSPLKIELIGTGEQAGTWGTTTNTNLGTALEEAITGRATATFPSDANYTLPYTDSNASQVFRNLVLNVTSSGNLSATRDLIIPAIEKQYIVENNTSGSQSIVVKTSGGSGVTIPNGRIANVFCDGTTTRLASDFVDINGGDIDGTVIGGSSAAAGSFTTATITTGNITTGNINTLTVGTQTNKATVSYTTDTARTLTIPNVGGNRTFAFIDEAQTFTANQTFNTLLFGTQTNKATLSYTTDAARTLTVPAVSGNRTFAFLEEAQTFTANQTIGADLIFTGNSRRITGPMSNTLVGERLLFQTSASNNVTAVGAIPSGTGSESRVSVFNTTDTVNYSALDIRCTATEAMVRSQADGTSSYLPLTFWNNIGERMRITTSGEVMIAGNTDQGAYNLQVNGTGVWAAGAYVNGSDAKIKKNVQTLPAALDTIEKLRPVTFEYRTDIGYTNDKGVHVGFVAQDLQEALAGKEYANTIVRDGGKYLSVSYQSIIPMLVKAVQELTERVKQLESK